MPTPAEYLIQRTQSLLPLDGDWDGPVWNKAGEMQIANFSANSEHRPRARAKLLYDDKHIHVLFDVQDQYVRCVHEGLHSLVFKDSCVEIFIQPDPSNGYFNFEANCGGTLLSYHVQDWRKVNGELTKFIHIPNAWMKKIGVYHSMPKRVEPEITEPVNWRLQLAIPFALMAAHAKVPDRPPGTGWRGNLYKCGDETSHPHWGSWSPLGPRLNFHQPEHFGNFIFAR